MLAVPLELPELFVEAELPLLKPRGNQGCPKSVPLLDFPPPVLVVPLVVELLPPTPPGVRPPGVCPPGVCPPPMVLLTFKTICVQTWRSKKLEESPAKS